MVQTKVRVRAAKRRIAEPYMHAGVHGADPLDLSASKGVLLQSILPGGTCADPDLLIEDLSAVAGCYVGWRTQRPAPRAMVRQSLSVLAAAASQFAVDSSKHDLQLRSALQDLPPEAVMMLCAAMGRTGDLPFSAEGTLFDEQTDWRAVSGAAAAAAANCRGGDYANVDLACAMQLLVPVIEMRLGCQATSSGNPDRPSLVCRLARAFFRIVDPELPEKSVDSALARLLRARRRNAPVNLSKSGSPTVI